MRLVPYALQKGDPLVAFGKNVRYGLVWDDGPVNWKRLIDSGDPTLRRLRVCALKAK